MILEGYKGILYDAEVLRSSTTFPTIHSNISARSPINLTFPPLFYLHQSHPIFKMDKAKAAINDFMHKSGHHDTTVHETVAPSVQHETIKPHRHEEVNTAIDKEVHQDHYHRTVQPVQDREVLPDKHTHNLAAVQHREVDHRDHDSTKRALQTEQSGFKNERVVEGTSHTQSASPTVAGEHVHHVSSNTSLSRNLIITNTPFQHIHETIQPIVHKETIQPNVVHTTVPIHETHHNAAQHHQTTTLPTVSLSDFQSRGGVLGGREERYDGFEGEPKNIGGAVAAGLKGHHNRDDSHQASGLTGSHGRSDPTGPHDSRLGNKADPRVDSDRVGGYNSGTGVGHNHSSHGHSDPTGPHYSRLGNRADPRVDSDRVGGTGNTSGGLTGNSHSHERGVGGVGAGTGHSDKHDLKHDQQHKPSLMDKLNPKVDSNGDGKAGIFK